MSIKLNLGVIDLPYSHTENKSLATTGDVAGYLENKYSIMQGFYDLHEQEITESISNSIQGSIDSVLQGANPATHNPFGSTTSFIQHKFHEFISTEEISKLGRKGVPTQVALLGKSSRFKWNKNKNKFSKRGKTKSGVRRPSFLDTGLYDSSFVAWVEVKD